MTDQGQLPARFYKALFGLVDDMRERTSERKEFSHTWKITVQQIRLLRTVERLTRTKSHDGVMLKTLAESLNVTSAAVSGMVETLVKRDFLERTQSKDDRRSIRIKLSKHCREKISSFDSFFLGMSEKIAESMPENEFRLLVEKLEELFSGFEKIIPPETELINLPKAGNKQ